MGPGWEKRDHEEQSWDSLLHVSVNCTVGHAVMPAVGLLVLQRLGRLGDGVVSRWPSIVEARGVLRLTPT